MGHLLPGSEDNYYQSSKVGVLRSLYGRLEVQQQIAEVKGIVKGHP
jgi:hypothetical protein